MIGGAERVLSYLGPAMARAGAEVTVLTSQPLLSRSKGTGSDRTRRCLSPLIEPIDGATVPGRCHVERLRTSRLRFAGTWLYMRELARWFASNRVDLAYVSMLKHDAYVVVGEGRRRGFPVVLRPEGAGLTGDLAWQSWGRFGRSIGRRCLQADAFVSISDAVRGELIEGGYDPARIVDLPNGVPVPDQVWTPPPPGPIRAAFVGRLALEKGLDTLVEAWGIVVASHPGARLTLVGEGPERPKLEGMVARLGLAGSVAMPGSTADPSIVLRESDVFVLPSREEGMSIAFLEAMALGIPSIATAIPGNCGLIDDGVHGRLVPPDDPPALARALMQDHPPTMAEAARRRVVEHYSIDAVARRHLDLFERLVAKSRMR